MAEETISGRLTANGHDLQQRVYFEDTDFSGRVYHARYLHFMERGRSDFLRLIGVRHRDLATESLSFAVSYMEIDFRKAASIDDVVTVRTRLKEATGARVVLDQSVLRESEVLVRATVTIALVGAAGRAVRLPLRVRDALATIGSSSNR